MKNKKEKSGLQMIREDIANDPNPEQALQEYKDMLNETSNAKIDSCLKRDKKGKVIGFDYIKMSQMYHSGNW